MSKSKLFVCVLNISFYSWTKFSLSHNLIPFHDTTHYVKLPGPPAPLWSQTSSWREQITINDKVEVRKASSLAQRPKWFRAIVKAVGKENDKVRTLEGGADLELYGDSKKGREKEHILLLNGKRQIRACALYPMVFFFPLVVYEYACVCFIINCNLNDLIALTSVILIKMNTKALLPWKIPNLGFCGSTTRKF